MEALGIEIDKPPDEIAKLIATKSKQEIEQAIFQNLHLDHSLRFYNKDGKSEIDFIVDEKVALEVKTSASKRDIDHLKRRSQSLNLSEAYIISKEYSKEKEVILAIDL